MLNWLKQRPFLFVMILCLSVASYHLVKHRWKGDSWKSTIQSDGSGYYAYLPAVFIYQDLQYRFYLDLKEKYKFGDLSENFLYTENNRLYNRYFCGTSIAMMPFFLLGWAAAEITGQDADGHSFFFTVSLNVAAIFYVLSGLYLMYRLFSRRYNKWTVALVCAAIFLGTNTFTYAIYHASYSHAYSFGFIALFIYLADRSIRLKTRNSLIHLALCLGMITIIRPTNAIVLISIPFLSGSYASFLSWFKFAIQPRVFLPAVMSCVCVIFIQGFMYHAQCGSWWTDGYPYETFYFDRPEIINMWFSYRAGVVMWSPVVIAALIGLLVMLVKEPFKGFSMLLFLLMNSWIISSWWAWHYSGTFGMRPMVDHMPFFIPLICTLFFVLRKVWMKTILVICLCSITFVGYTFNKQYITSIIPWDGMTKEKYWYIFMKTGGGYAFRLFEPYRPPIPPLQNIMIKHIAFDPADPSAPFLPLHENYHADTLLHYSGRGLQQLINMPLWSVRGSGKYYGEIRLDAFYTSVYNKGELYVNFKSGKETIHTERLLLVIPDFKPNRWNKLRYSFITEIPNSTIDHLELEMHNGPNLPVYLQKLEVTLASL